MSTGFDRSGNSQDSLGGRDERTTKTIEEWELDGKRFGERLHYRERTEYRCTVVGPRGFEVKCHKNCSKCAYYWYRRPNKVSVDRLQECGVEIASDHESPIQYAERMEKAEKVDEAIGTLPSEDLKLVARMFSESYSFADIGKALGISKQAAHKKWERAKGILREELQGYWNSINP